MKRLIIALAILAAVPAIAGEYATGIIRPGERIFLSEKPCIYNGRAYYTINAAAKHVMSRNKFVDGCWAVQGPNVFFMFNDGDEGWIRARELELAR